jgi:trehalose-6-phosphate synthase
MPAAGRAQIYNSLAGYWQVGFAATRKQYTFCDLSDRLKKKQSAMPFEQLRIANPKAASGEGDKMHARC